MALTINGSYDHNISTFTITRSIQESHGMTFGLADPAEFTAELVGLLSVPFSVGDQITAKSGNANLGVFFVSSVEYTEWKNGKFNVTIHAFDALSKLTNVQYNPTGSITACSTICTAAKTAMGVTGSSLNGTLATGITAGQYSLLQALNYCVTASNQLFGFINQNGEFQAGWSFGYSVSHDKEYLLEVKKSGKTVEFAGLKGGTDSAFYTSGSAPYLLVENPHISQSSVSTLKNSAVQIKQTPITARWKDSASFLGLIQRPYSFRDVWDEDTQTYKWVNSYPTSITVTYNGASSIVEFTGFDTATVDTVAQEENFNPPGSIQDNSNKSQEPSNGEFGDKDINTTGKITAHEIECGYLTVNHVDTDMEDGYLRMDCDVSCEENLIVEGDTHIKGNLQIDGSLTYQNSPVFNCDVIITGSGNDLDTDVHRLILNHNYSESGISVQVNSYLDTFRWRGIDEKLGWIRKLSKNGNNFNSGNEIFFYTCDPDQLSLGELSHFEDAAEYGVPPSIFIKQSREKNGATDEGTRTVWLSPESLHFSDRFKMFQDGQHTSYIPYGGFSIGYDYKSSDSAPVTIKVTFYKRDGTTSSVYNLTEANIAALANLT